MMLRYTIINSDEKYRVTIKQDKETYICSAYETKQEIMYETIIIDKKLYNRLVCALESKNDYQIRITTGNSGEEQILKFVIESEHSDDTMIELPIKQEKNTSTTYNDIVRLTKSIKALGMSTHVPMILPTRVENLSDTNVNLFKKIETYLTNTSQYKTELKEILKEKISETTTNGSIQHKYKYFTRSDYKLPEHMENVILYIFHKICSKITECVFKNLLKILLEEKMLKCTDTGWKGCCAQCLDKIKSITSCYNELYRGNGYVPICNTALNRRDVRFTYGERTTTHISCSQAIQYNMNDIVILKYYEIMYNMLSEDGYHPINFSKDKKFVKCIRDESKVYRYRFVLTYAINDKYYDVIKYKPIDITQSNIMKPISFGYSLNNRDFCNFGSGLNFPDIERYLFVFYDESV